MKVNKRFRELTEHVQAQQTRDDVLTEFFERLEKQGKGGEGRMSLPALSKTSKGDTPLESSRVNFDYLKVWVYGTHDSGAALSEELERMQTAARENNDDERLFVLGGRCGQMRPYGFGKLAYSMPFAMVVNGAEIGFADLRKEWKGKGERPQMLIEFKGQYCTGRTPFDLAEEIFQWAKAFGFKNVRTQVSRVDIAVDRSGFAVKDAELMRIKGEVITKSSKDSSWREHGKISGIRYGQTNSACKLTIYDKKNELRQNPDKASIYYAAFPEAKEQEQITRYEWSLKRENLVKRHSIDTVEELLDCLPDLVRYLATEWYREIDLDSATRASRCNVTSPWQKVLNDCKAMLGGDRPLARKRTVAPRSTPTAQSLWDQGIGCLLSRATLLGIRVESLTELMASGVIDSPARDLQVKQEQEVRRKELSARRRHFDGVVEKKVSALEKIYEIQKAAAEIHERYVMSMTVPF